MKDRMRDFKSLMEAANKSLDDIDTAVFDDLDSGDLCLRSDTERFFEESSSLKENMVYIRNVIGELERMQNKILGSPIQDPDINSQRDMFMTIVRDDSASIHKRLKTMEKELSEDSDSRLFMTERKMKKDQLNALLLYFQDTMGQFNTVQMRYRDKCKSRIQRQLQITGNEKTNEEIESMLDNGDITSTFLDTQLMAGTKDALSALKEVENRHQEIVRLEESIQELFQMFTEISYLVSNQSEVLDCIEHNVNEASEAVLQTNKKIKTAYMYKRKSILFCCLPAHLPCVIL